MAVNILIDKNGNLVNGIGSNILEIASPINALNQDSLWWNQIHVQCFNGIITQSSGIIFPDTSTVVRNPGLSGTLSFNIWPSIYAPNSVTIAPTNVIDLSTAGIIQWAGNSGKIDIVVSAISGCNYINVVIDRGIRALT